MSIFESLDRVNSQVVDRINAIEFVLTPMIKPTPNSRRLPDTSRPVVFGRCVFEFMSKDVGIEMGVRKTYREANDLRSLMIGRDPEVSIDRKYFQTVSDEPHQGDIIEFPGKPELPKFEVMDTMRDGLSRLVCRLVMYGVQS